MVNNNMGEKQVLVFYSKKKLDFYLLLGIIVSSIKKRIREGGYISTGTIQQVYSTIFHFHWNNILWTKVFKKKVYHNVLYYLNNFCLRSGHLV